MKKALCIVLFSIFILGCDNPADCVKSTGRLVSREVEVTSFEKINVFKQIGLVIKQGDFHKVEVRTGENLIDDIEVIVQNNTLILKDNTSCNWVRDYGQTIVYITAPNITEIRSKTEQNIVSDGVLTYPSLTLIAFDKDGDGIEGAGTGDFILELDCNQLTIGNNNVANYYLSGKTTDCFVGFYNGNGILRAENLEITNLGLYHRGFNDMHVNVIQTITGDLYATGNLVIHTTPATVNVTRHYQGKVIYN
jgi:hypothetical protein